MSVTEPTQKNKIKIVSSSYIDFKRNIVKRIYTSEIKDTLPKSYVFERLEFCLYILKKIEKQQKGEQGELILLNNTSNRFFVYGENLRTYVVGIGWSSMYQHWAIHTIIADSCNWDINSRVFFPTDN